MNPSIWTPEPRHVIPPGLRKPIFPGERGWAEAYRLAGLVNGGMVNGGHAMVNAGIIRAAVAAPSSEPDPFGSPTNRWTASTAVTPSPLYTTIAGSTPAVADGDPVGGWVSGFGNASRVVAQADNATRATLKLNIINGQPVVRFDGSNDNLKATFTRNQPHTIFIVGKTTGNTTSFLFDGTASANTPQCINEASATNYDIYAGGAAVASITIPDSTPFIYCAVFNGASSRARLNAGTAATANVGSNNATGLTVASRWDNVNFHACDIGEIVIYDSALSTGDETSERDVLNAWWAIF